ncbi:MAG TPA: helix-turn-helix domain-containing protein [Acidimicrobiales bacterium]
MLVVERDYRGWRDLVYHDHAAYEQRLENTILSLLGRTDPQPEAVSLVSATATVLGALVAGLQTRVVTGPLVVDFLSDTAELDGRLLALGPIEWDVLVYLARRLGEVVSYDELTAWVWPAARRHAGRPHSLQPSRASLRSVLLRLRGHLGDAGRLIVVLRAEGVMLSYEAPTGGV